MARFTVMQQVHSCLEHFAGASFEHFAGASAVIIPVDILLLLQCCTLPHTADAASSTELLHSEHVISFLPCAEFDHMHTPPLFNPDTLICSSYPPTDKNTALAAYLKPGNCSQFTHSIVITHKPLGRKWQCCPCSCHTT